jgi:hypothetical protein
MADESIEIELNVNASQAKAEVDKVKNQIDSVGQKAKKTGKEAGLDFKKGFGDIGSLFGGVFGQAAGAFGKLTQAVNLGSKAFGGLRAAIISTGIGAIVIAIVAVIAAVSRLQSVQDGFKQATAAVGAVVAKLGDVLALVGQAIIDAFTNPQQAIKDLTAAAEAVLAWFSELGSYIKGNLIVSFLRLKIGVLEAAAATKEFFGADATELRAQILDATLSITELKKELEATEKVLVQPFKDAAAAVAEFAQETAKAAMEAANLEKSEQNLAKIQIKQIESQARRNKEIARLRLIYEEEGRTMEEREAALRSALALENENLQERLANAREEARIIEGRNALSISNREDEKREAEARAKVLDLERESLSFQKEITAQLRGLSEQRKAQAEAARQAELKEFESFIQAQDQIAKALAEQGASDEEKELAAAADKYDKLLDLAQQHNMDLLELEEAREAELDAIQQKFREQRQAKIDEENQVAKDKADEQQAKDLEDAQTLESAKLALASASIGAIESLANLAFANNEKRARQAFQVTKALRLGEAVANTYAGVNAVLADPSLPTLAKPFLIGTTIATGIANVAKIASSKFTASGGANPSGGGGGGAGRAQTPNIPAIQATGANQNTIQAYVIEQNVSNSQQANQRIKEVSAL